VGITVLGLVQMRQQEQLQAAVDATNDQLSLAQQWRGQTQVNLARALSLAKADNNPQLDAYLAPQMKATSAEISVLQKKLTEGALSAAAARPGGHRRRPRELPGHPQEGAGPAQGDAGAAAEVDRSLLPAADAYLASMNHLEEVLNGGHGGPARRRGLRGQRPPADDRHGGAGPGHGRLDRLGPDARSPGPCSMPSAPRKRSPKAT
jgi:methyl-accepting chemotaxis protein